MAKTEEQIKNEMEANSKAWHTADTETRKNLEAANQELGKQIGGVYDAAAGKWSDSNGNPLFGSSNTNANGGVDINGAIDDSKKLIDKQIENLNNYQSSMTKLQQDRTDFEIKKIEQQKEQAKKDLEKEKTAAYTDYKKQINPYGVNAEQLASQGMSGTGYAESSKVKMYSDYQNRVAIAKQSYDQAVVSYNNAMTEARLQNSTVLAQLAFDTLQKSLELSLQGLQYKNELLIQAEERNYNRAWNEEQRNYERAIYEEEKKYNRDWNEEQRNYERTIYEEEKKYNREQDAVSVALQKASLGDYSALEALGWKIDYDKINYEKNSTEWAKKLELAEVSAKYGNFEPLRKLGIGVTPEYEEDFNQSLQNAGTIWAFDDGYSTETKEEIDKSTPGDNGKWTTDTTYVTDTHVKTPYYEGEKNADGKTYGYFANGYQPKGIEGYGKVKKTGRTEIVSTEIQYGTYKGTRTLIEQNIWQTHDGTLWLWDGLTNKYVVYFSPHPVYPGAIDPDLLPDLLNI